MTRRLVTLVLAIAAIVATVAAGSAAAADHSPTLSGLSSAEFPERAYVLTLPDKRALAAADVEVTENGQSVSEPTIVPADRLGWGGFATVLVIDASNSMAGDAITGAMRAARAFAANRNEHQALGIVTFSARPTTVLPLTTEASAIESALRRPPGLALGTGVRDATRSALAMLKRERITGGSVVVLSDGADTSSKATAAATIADARAIGARIYSVGLDSAEFTADTLEDLADGTGGGYALAASSKGLEAIFERLGAELSNQYLLRYRSLAQPDEDVTVRAEVAGFSHAAVARYRSPALDITSSGPYQPSLLNTFLGSILSVIVVALFCAALVGGAVLAVLRNPGGGVLERIQRFVPRAERTDQDGRVVAKPQGRGAQGSIFVRWMARLREDLDIARIEIPTERLVLLVAAATLLAMWVFAVASGAPGAAILALSVPVCVRAIVGFKAARQRRLFGEQLPDNVQIVASAMRAGQSFVGALAILVNEAAEPSRREFARAIQDERLGKPIEESLGEVAVRMESEELEYIGLVARLQSETGGNTAEVLDRLVETLRARADLRRLVRTLTSQGRLASYVIGALPLVILVAVTVLNRNYAERLFETGSGHVMLAVSGVLMALGAYALRRIVDIKV